MSKSGKEIITHITCFVFFCFKELPTPLSSSNSSLRSQVGRRKYCFETEKVGNCSDMFCDLTLICFQFKTGSPLPPINMYYLLIHNMSRKVSLPYTHRSLFPYLLSPPDPLLLHFLFLNKEHNFQGYQLNIP